MHTRIPKCYSPIKSVYKWPDQEDRKNRHILNFFAFLLRSNKFYIFLKRKRGVSCMNCTHKRQRSIRLYMPKLLITKIHNLSQSTEPVDQVKLLFQQREINYFLLALFEKTSLSAYNAFLLAAC